MICTQSIYWQIGTFAAGAVLTALLLAIGHWFPWPHPLSRIRCYVYGTASIWAGFALWRALNGDWITFTGLLVIAGVGGATVKGAYKLDEWVRQIRQSRKAAAADDELE